MTLMGNNYGKEFEQKIKTAFENLPETTIIRLYDTTSGYIGVANPCDYIASKFPIFFAIECKSHYGNTLSINSTPTNNKHFYGDITDTQWKELEKMDAIHGVVAGYMIWYIDKDITVFVPASELVRHRDLGNKSLNYKDLNSLCCYFIPGKKKRVFYEYELSGFYKWALKWANKKG